MSIKNPPTYAQFRGLREMASQMGVNKMMIQTLIDDGSFVSKMQERRNQIREWECNVRTIELSATVQRDFGLEELLKLYEYYIDYNTNEVNGLHSIIHDDNKRFDYILMNFSKCDGSWTEALAWSRIHGRKRTKLRDVLAVTDEHNLSEIIGETEVGSYITATTECFVTSQDKTLAPAIDVNRSFKQVELYGLDNFGEKEDWFLFRK